MSIASGNVANIRQIGQTLVLTPIVTPQKTLRALLDSWEPMDEDCPDVGAGLLPLDDNVL